MLHNWLHRILHYEATPPEAAWKNITNELDKEEIAPVDVKDKLLNHTQTPPAFVLDNIFAELDKEAAPAFVEKINTYQQTPPPAAWKNIINEIDDKKIISFKEKKKDLRPLYISIAVAASIVTALLLTILPGNNKNDNSGSTKTVIAKPQQQVIASKKLVEETATPVINKDTKKEVVKTAVKQTTPVQSTPAFSNDYLKGNAINDLATAPELLTKEKLQDANGQTPMNIAFLNTPNTYISITGADGQSVKVSSKFANLIGYFNGANDTKEGIDIIIEESAKWKATILAWRNKMTNNTIAPSLSNFMDIIELSNVLEEKK